MPPNNLRSITALVNRKCRNLSSSRSSYVTKVATFLTRVSGFTLGAGVGYLIVGNAVSIQELNRQQNLRDWAWLDPVEIEDLREKMWPELREKKWFQDMQKIRSALMDKMFSGPKS